VVSVLGAAGIAQAAIIIRPFSKAEIEQREREKKTEATDESR